MSQTILPGKGKQFRNCNRTACQSPDGVVFWNRATRAYYCRTCADLILQNCTDEEREQIFPDYNENIVVYKTMQRTIRHAKQIF